MKDVLVLQHAEAEGLGSLETALRRAGQTFKVVRAFAGETVPTKMGDTAGLVVLGGPMSVAARERWPFLDGELRLITNAVEEAKPVLGICLGAQLLAASLGAKVEPGVEEMGWYPVQLHLDVRHDPLFGGLEPTLVPLHWHRDRFDLPKGAVWLAHSERTRYQAFRFGASAYGLLFHLESSVALVEHMLGDLDGNDGSVSVAALRSATRERVPLLEPIAARVFDGWAGLLRH